MAAVDVAQHWTAGIAGAGPEPRPIAFGGRVE
jgi:hypothetical protein